MLSILISSKCMSEAKKAMAESRHVLIFTPLFVLINLHFVIITPITYFPKLPMLMPCPYPLVTLVKVIFLLLSPTETQSSPLRFVYREYKSLMKYSRKFHQYWGFGRVQ